jgi:hypothetical protein
VEASCTTIKQNSQRKSREKEDSWERGGERESEARTAESQRVHDGNMGSIVDDLQGSSPDKSAVATLRPAQAGGGDDVALVARGAAVGVAAHTHAAVRHTAVRRRHTLATGQDVVRHARTALKLAVGGAGEAVRHLAAGALRSGDGRHQHEHSQGSHQELVHRGHVCLFFVVGFSKWSRKSPGRREKWLDKDARTEMQVRE